MPSKWALWGPKWGRNGSKVCFSKGNPNPSAWDKQVKYTNLEPVWNFRPSKVVKTIEEGWNRGQNRLMSLVCAPQRVHNYF